MTTSDPATVAIIVGSTAGTGIAGAYFDNAEFTSQVLTRTDPQINCDWGTGSPAGSIGGDTFSVRWDGLLRVPETGTYTFSTLNSDGARLHINGQMVIDDFVDQEPNWTDSIPLNLTAGQLIDLQMLYFSPLSPESAPARPSRGSPSAGQANPPTASLTSPLSAPAAGSPNNPTSRGAARRNWSKVGCIDRFEAALSSRSRPVKAGAMASSFPHDTIPMA